MHFTLMKFDCGLLGAIIECVFWVLDLVVVYGVR